MKRIIEPTLTSAVPCQGVRPDLRWVMVKVAKRNAAQRNNRSPIQSSACRSRMSALPAIIPTPRSTVAMPPIWLLGSASRKTTHEMIVTNTGIMTVSSVETCETGANVSPVEASHMKGMPAPISMRMSDDALLSR